MITIVTGAPCSGKSTYINDRAKPGDVIVDLDPISRALTFNADDGHLVPEYIGHIAVGARNGAIKRALKLREHRNGVNVFIVHTAPKPSDLAIYRSLKCEIVNLDPGKDVCLERAERLRPHVAAVIEDWYSGRLHRARPLVMGDDDSRRDDL
jgi:hypothetical protein